MKSNRYRINSSQIRYYSFTFERAAWGLRMIGRIATSYLIRSASWRTKSVVTGSTRSSFWILDNLRKIHYIISYRRITMSELKEGLRDLLCLTREWLSYYLHRFLA